VAGKPGGEYSGTEGDTEIGVHILARFEAGTLLEKPGNERGAGGAADEQNAIHVARFASGILEGFGDAVEGGFDQGADQLFVALAGDFHFQVQGLAVLDEDGFLAQLHIRFEAEFLFRLFGGPPEAGFGGGMAQAHIDAVAARELIGEQTGEKVVEVVAAEVVVAVAGQHLGDVSFVGDDGDIECTAA